MLKERPAYRKNAVPACLHFVDENGDDVDERQYQHVAGCLVPRFSR